MITLTTLVLFLCAIVMALYAFGLIRSPSHGAFRTFQWTFYLLAVLTVLSVWFGMTDEPSF
ncbi:MAG TPA: hypothetical protein PKA61_14515 [Nitrospira sp.]|nr:hypothetical protein [Nitrospira sp.]